MRKRTKNKWVLIGGCIIVGLCAIILLKTSSKPDLMITFTGYTNNASGLLSANFIVSNVTAQTVFLTEKGSVQWKEQGEWIGAAATNSIVIALERGESFLLNVFKPTNGGPWRVFMTSGRPRSSILRRIGGVYERQPVRVEPFSYLLLSPVLRHTYTYSEEITD